MARGDSLGMPSKCGTAFLRCRTRLGAMLPMFTARAVEFIRRRAPGQKRAGVPFFLYLPLTAPHSPVVPNKEFEGMSGIGAYGDLVCEIDDLAGKIRSALAENGLLENTIFVFASDNGPEFQTADDEGAFERARRTALVVIQRRRLLEPSP
ncbi:sulfatase-like hydrolase/transferase [Mesorhizobium sp. B3-1-6]|uniref:sulfatase-like hydrolase/transferase n=1 Tax=Mesorhizobium sp. B3-1-6 TaxID=2589895 RepID=UPI0015E42CE4|nr:sulfatase-like hydrolase/transferase [Mesorhizobium sp. B3-1-6]